MAQSVEDQTWAEMSEDKFLNQVLELRRKRDQDIVNFQALRESIQKSETIIKGAAQKRLQLAKALSADKLQDALCTQFILGGVEGAIDSYKIETVPGVFPRTTLKDSSALLAIRIEENPAFPLFLIATGGNQNADDVKFVNKLESNLKRLVKPYARMPQGTIEQYLKWGKIQ